MTTKPSAKYASRPISCLLFSLGIIFAVGFACTIMARSYTHEKLQVLTSRLKDYPLPPNAKVIKIESSMWEHTGNGDYCHYRVLQTIETSLSRADIEAYYTDAVIPGINEGGYTQPILLDFPEQQPIGDLLLFTAQVKDMSERAFNFGCK